MQKCVKFALFISPGNVVTQVRSAEVLNQYISIIIHMPGYALGPSCLAISPPFRSDMKNNFIVEFSKFF